MTVADGPASRVRVHNFSVSLDGFGTGEGQSLEAPFGHAGHRLRVGPAHADLPGDGLPRRPVAHGGRGRGVRQPVEHRRGRGDHGPQQVRPVAGAVGRAVARMVGGRSALPHPGGRAHPSPAPGPGTGRREQLPFPRRPARRGAGLCPRSGGGRRREDRGAAPRRSGSSSRPTSSTRCTSRWSRSSWAGASGCGTDWRVSRSGSTSRPLRRPAVSPT